MKTKRYNRTSGALHDLTAILEYPADDCNVLLVSSRTLAILHNYALGEVNWYARYYVSRLPGGYVTVPDKLDVEALDIDELARNYRLEVQDMSCDLTAALAAITSAINNLAEKVSQQQTFDLCCPDGAGTEPPMGEVDISDTPIGPGEEHETLADYYTAKCNTANWIVDDLILLITDFQLRDIQDLAAGSVTIAWAMVGVAIAASGVGALTGAVVGLLGAIVSLVLGPVIFDLGDLVTVLNALRDDLKQALFCSNSNSDARSRFLAELEGEGLSLLEVEFVSLFLNNNVLSVLFRPTEESKLYDGEYDCEDCPTSGLWMISPIGMFPTTWDFGSTIFTGAGTVDNSGETFQINSVSFVDGGDGLTKHIISLCTVDFYYQWLELGSPVFTAFPDQTGQPCIGSPGLEVIGGQPSAASIDWRSCLSGEWDDSGAGIFSPNPNPDLMWFAQYRFTGGAFSESFAVPQ
jgi:hypothetical protein